MTVAWQVGMSSGAYEFVSIDEEEHLVKRKSETKVTHVPLDRVETVHLDEDNRENLPDD